MRAARARPAVSLTGRVTGGLLAVWLCLVVGPLSSSAKLSREDIDSLERDEVVGRYRRMGAECCQVDVHYPNKGHYYSIHNLRMLSATVNPCCAMLVANRSIEADVKVKVKLDGRTILARELGDGGVYVKDFTDSFSVWVAPAEDGKQLDAAAKWGAGDHTLLVLVYFSGKVALGGAAKVQFTTGYAKHGQDLWALTSFRAHHEEMFWVDVGAFDAFYLSNSFVLQAKGWSGLAIDPFPVESTWRTRANMSLAGRHRLVRVALDREERRVPFCSDHQEGGGIYSVDGGILEYFEGEGRRCLASEGHVVSMVDAQTAAQVLDAHLTKRRAPDCNTKTRQCKIFRGHRCTIHYLSVDTEGNEAAVLSAFPFDDFFVVAISVMNSPQHASTVADILKPHGFLQQPERDWHDSYWIQVSVDYRREIPPTCRLVDVEEAMGKAKKTEL